MRQVFIDLDGVLADFLGGFRSTFSTRWEDKSYKDRWELVAAHPNFFGSLERFSPDLVKTFQATYGAANVHILTSVPDSNFERYAVQKRDWVRANVPELEGLILFSRGGTRKFVFMQNKQDILIDDTWDNIRAWRVNGGYGIHYNMDDGD